MTIIIIIMVRVLSKDLFNMVISNHQKTEARGNHLLSEAFVSHTP